MGGDMEKKFENEELEKAVRMAKEMGLKVWTSDNIPFNIIRYVFFDNGKTYGYCEASFGGVTYSTRHKVGQRHGTGFRMYNTSSMANKEDIARTLRHAPSWAYNMAGEIKKMTFEQHIKEVKILKYYEL